MISLLSASIESDIQVRRWKTAYGQYRICYTGDLSNDFLRVELSFIDNGSHASKVDTRCIPLISRLNFCQSQGQA